MKSCFFVSCFVDFPGGAISFDFGVSFARIVISQWNGAHIVVKLSVTAIILTFNESIHIKRCIDSLTPVIERICVVDSGSTDDTVILARSLGAEVFFNPWINYASQMNWGLANCNISTDWVLRIDADEYFEQELQQDLASRLSLLSPDISGVIFKRKYYFLGRWIKHGGLHPLYHLRLWRNGRAMIEQRWMDEHAVLDGGRTTQFEGAFVDCNLRDLAWWSEKHVSYATREAVQVVLEKIGQSSSEISPHQSSEQASTKRWLKQAVYNRLPLGLGPLLYTLYRLLIRLGILDGFRGVAFHLLQGFWYRLLVDLRRYELQIAIADLPTVDTKLDMLETLTRLKIRAFLGKGDSGLSRPA